MKAPTTTKRKPATAQNALVGMFLHTFVDGKIELQGLVLKTDAKWAMVQLFSWMSGEPTQVQPMLIADLHALKNCKLYASQERWLFEAEYGAGSPRRT